MLAKVNLSAVFLCGLSSVVPTGKNMKNENENRGRGATGKKKNREAVLLIESYTSNMT